MCVTERNPGGGEVTRGGGGDKESGGLGTGSTVQQWRLWKRGEKVRASRLERVEKSAWGDTGEERMSRNEREDVEVSG